MVTAVRRSRMRAVVMVTGVLAVMVVGMLAGRHPRRGHTVDSAHLRDWHAAHLSSTCRKHGHRRLQDQGTDGGPQGKA